MKNLLEKNQGLRFAKDLIEDLNRSSVTIDDSGGLCPKNHLLLVYTRRQQVEKEINNDMYVKGYEELLNNVKKSVLDEFAIVSCYSKTGTYIVFTDKDKTELIGILKSPVIDHSTS